MAKLSLLTGRPGPERTAAPAPAAKPAQGGDEGALTVLMKELDRMAGELQSARAEVVAARAEALLDRGKAEVSRQELAAAVAGRVAAEGQVATAQAQLEGVRGQLTTEQTAREALRVPLEQAIAAAAKPPHIVQPTPAEALSYELDMSERDLNGRVRKAFLKPVKAT